MKSVVVVVVVVGVVVVVAADDAVGCDVFPAFLLLKHRLGSH